MTPSPRPWTAADLDRLREASAAGEPAASIARLLGRDESDVEERLALLRHSSAEAVEPAMGPDEEGDVIPALGQADDDAAAWVHVNRQREP